MKETKLAAIAARADYGATVTVTLLAELRAADLSWYRIARTLNVTDQSVDAWRKGRSQMSNDTAARALAWLNKSKPDIARAMAKLQMEVARTDEAREVWKDMLKRLGGLAAGVLMMLGGGPTPPAAGAAGAPVVHRGEVPVYYVKRRRGAKRRRAWVDALRRNFIPALFPAAVSPA